MGQLVTVVVIVLVIAAPIAVLVRRLRRGDEPVEGGSLGRQIAGGKDDWGPKPS